MEYTREELEDKGFFPIRRSGTTDPLYLGSRRNYGKREDEQKENTLIIAERMSKGKYKLSKGINGLGKIIWSDGDLNQERMSLQQVLSKISKRLRNKDYRDAKSQAREFYEEYVPWTKSP